MARKTGKCPECDQVKKLTEHHIFPKRWAKYDRRMPYVTYRICRSCHDELEHIIDKAEFGHNGQRKKKLREFYVVTLEVFVGRRIPIDL